MRLFPFPRGKGLGVRLQRSRHLKSAAQPLIVIRYSSVARARQIGYRLRLLGMSNQYTSYVKARSSVVERFPDTEEVGGSIPPVPTSSVLVAASPVHRTCA